MCSSETYQDPLAEGRSSRWDSSVAAGRGGPVVSSWQPSRFELINSSCCSAQTFTVTWSVLKLTSVFLRRLWKQKDVHANRPVREERCLLEMILWDLCSQSGRGWQGPLWVTQPNPLPKQGHPEQPAQDLVQVGLEYLQRRRLHNLPGQPGPVLCHVPRWWVSHVLLCYVSKTWMMYAGGPISSRCVPLHATISSNVYCQNDSRL